MNINLDDPLAGILSDGSDDSFFDDDILGKKKPVKKKTTPSIERRSAIFNLDNVISKENLEKKEFTELKLTASKSFITSDRPEGITQGSHDNSKNTFKYLTEDESKNSVSSHIKDVPSRQNLDVKKSPFKSKIQIPKDKINYLDEVMGSKGDDSKPTEKSKDSQDLLNDLLGKPSKKANQTNPGVSKNENFDMDGNGKNEKKNSCNSKKTKNESNVLNKNELKKTKTSDDWLGIFQDENEVIDGDGIEVPAWLGGGKSKKIKSTEKDTKLLPLKEIESNNLKPSTVETNDGNSDQVVQNVKEEVLISNIITYPNKNIFPDVNELQNNATDVTMQGATLYLQQQEAQLMVAMQLKAQDEKLAAMQVKQKEAQRVQREAALAQHTQLDDMLQRQANHRIQMQAIINAHQDRIAQRIKDLLESGNKQFDEMNETGNDHDSESKGGKDSPSNKEKKQLLQLLQSLQENHDKEIDILETSYRRQLAFIEVSLNQTEERMRGETEKQIKFYTEKINWLEEHHQLYKKWTVENTNSLIERHNTEKEMLRQQHLENVRGLQEHHSALMENIRNAVKQEQVLVRDSAGFSMDIQDLLSDVKDSKVSCQQLVDKIEKMTINTQDEVERSMKVRESQIDNMIEQLKKERNYFEQEKTETKNTINMLELRLKQMTAMMEEESAALKQKKMEFEFEKATFVKQTEFAKNVLKKQHEEVKMIKDAIEKEYNEKMIKMNEDNARGLKEAAALAKERASIQNLKMELEKTKAELQAQLEEASEERSKIKIEKNELHMEQQRILAKSREIELLTKTTLEKQSQAEKQCSEADSVQKKYEEGVRRLQEHVLSLNAREKQIAREKIALSRERISLHNERKRMEGENQCSLCRSVPRASQYEAPASRDYDANVNHALSNIEMEMAQLMGRSYALRHEPALASVRTEISREEPISGDGGNVSSETGVFKDYMDPKFMMLRLDVQKVINNLNIKSGTLNKN